MNIVYMSKSHPQGAGNYQGNEDLMDKNIRDIIKYIYRIDSDIIHNYLLFADFHPEQVFHLCVE